MPSIPNISGLQSAGTAAAKNIGAKALSDFNKLTPEQIAKKFEDQVNKIKGLAEKNPLNDLKKKAKDAKDEAKKQYAYLKEEVSGGISGSDLYALFVPVIKKIIKQLYSVEKIKNLIIKEVTEQLKKKGKVEIQGKKVVFTPIKYDPAYQNFADGFNSKVKALRTGLTAVQVGVNSLDRIVSTINTIITIANVAIKVIKVILNIRLKKIAAELALPTPSKPTAGLDLANVINQLDKVKKLEDKVELYQTIVGSLTIIITLIKTKIDTILAAINGLELVIVSNKNQPNNPQLDGNLTNDLSSLQGNPDPNNTGNINETYNANDGKSYYLTIERLADGSYQAIAIDTFTGLKITQTAPSKFVKPNALFAELKQILNT